MPQKRLPSYDGFFFLQKHGAFNGHGLMFLLSLTRTWAKLDEDGDDLCYAGFRSITLSYLPYYHSPLHHHNTIHTKRTYMNIHEHTWTYIPPNLDHASAYSGSLNYPCFFHFQLDRCKTTTLHEGLDPGAMFNSPVMKVGTTRSPCQICKALEVKSAKFWLYFGTGTFSCYRCNLFKSTIGIELGQFPVWSCLLLLFLCFCFLFFFVVVVVVPSQ